MMKQSTDQEVVTNSNETKPAKDYEKEYRKYAGLYHTETKKMKAEIDALKSQLKPNKYEDYDQDQLDLIKSVANEQLEERERAVERDKFLKKEEQLLTNTYPEAYEHLDEVMELKQQKMYSNRSLKKIYETYMLGVVDSGVQTKETAPIAQKEKSKATTFDSDGGEPTAEELNLALSRAFGRA